MINLRVTREEARSLLYFLPKNPDGSNAIGMHAELFNVLQNGIKDDCRRETEARANDWRERDKFATEAGEVMEAVNRALPETHGGNDWNEKCKAFK